MMRKDSPNLSYLLQLLNTFHIAGQEWVSTREVADRLDMSVYQARMQLLTLESRRQVKSSESRKGKARYWKRCGE